MNELSVNLNTANMQVDRQKTAETAYSLRASNHTSNHYYIDIANFADQWTHSLHPWLDEKLEKVQKYRMARRLPPRKFDELALELLALGVALHEHGVQAVQTPAWVVRALGYLIARQEKEPRLEKWMKFLRGCLNGMFYRESGVLSTRALSFVDVKKLVEWLRVQGAETQAERYADWLAFFAQVETQVLLDMLSTSQDLARDFILQSDKYLAKYTRKNNAYRLGLKRAARWRYDILLVDSTQAEYHLGMLATEILNRNYRKDFDAAKSRLVILPPCICAQPEGSCRAVQTPQGAQCTGCTPGCRVNQITVAANQKGVRVVMIPDDELSKLCVSTGQAGSGLGVIGVACALRNWSAGWEAERLGLHAQGVLLDYPGCSKHWNREGLSTDLNVQQILNRLPSQANNETNV